jgi:hypothetical protein
MKETDDARLPKCPELESCDRRRAIIGFGGTALAVLVPTTGKAQAEYLAPAVGPAAYPSGQLKDIAPPKDGFFLILDSKNGDSDPRIFFLSSSWLPYFEVTDLMIDKNDSAKYPKFIKRARARRSVTAIALYVEDLGNENLLVNPDAVNVPDPGGKTYLAMSISPAL